MALNGALFNYAFLKSVLVPRINTVKTSLGEGVAAP